MENKLFKFMDTRFEYDCLTMKLNNILGTWISFFKIQKIVTALIIIWGTIKTKNEK